MFFMSLYLYVQFVHSIWSQKSSSAPCSRSKAWVASPFDRSRSLAMSASRLKIANSFQFWLVACLVGRLLAWYPHMHTRPPGSGSTSVFHTKYHQQNGGESASSGHVRRASQESLILRQPGQAKASKPIGFGKYEPWVYQNPSIKPRKL